MMTIELNDLQFFARHGMYEEEQILGNEFVVNVRLKYQHSKEPVTTLEETINYVDVFNLVKDAMAKPTPLLETVVTLLGETIRESFAMVTAVEISIRKKRPPVEGWIGDVTVKYKWGQDQ